MWRPVTVTGLLLGLALQAVPCAAQSGTLDVGDAEIHYAVAGDGAAVVLIHGWALNLREWDDQVAALSPHYRVVAIDRRGFGRSTGFADPSADPGDVKALLDALQIPSAVLVGHSAGADVAARFAAALPERVRGLVLYGGPPPSGFPGAPPEGSARAWLRTMAQQVGLDSLFQIMRAQPRFQPGPHRSAAVGARLDSIMGAYSGRDLLEDHPQSGAYPPAELAAMRRWHMPVLFISGERESPLWQAVTDSLFQWMPNARKVVIPGGGHGVHFDEPARFNAALLAFLRDVGGS
jgi:pimeloyl-ACP methyl ester carboxylesterase